MRFAHGHRSMALAATLTMIGALSALPSPAAAEGRTFLVRPQLVIPIGDLGDLSGTGYGFGVTWRRPLDSELAVIASTATLGFRRRSEPTTLFAVEQMMGLPEDTEVTRRLEVVAVPALVGLERSDSGLYASVQVGDLYTRVDEHTELSLPASSDAGFASVSHHGLLLSLAAGLERDGGPFTGVELNFAPGRRGPDGESGFTWLSIFVTL